MLRRVAVTCLIMVALAWPIESDSQTGRRGKAKASRVMAQAIAALTAEAEQLKREEKPPSNVADFAQRFNKEIAAEDVLAVIVKPAHADAFTDAYIRWQLTAYKPNMAGLEDAQFVKMLSTMPALLANPRAEAGLIEVFKKVDKSGPLAGPELARVRQISDDLERRTALVEAFNGPANLFRDWVLSQCGETGPRRLQCLIERAAATITAGWPSREIKSTIGKAFKSAAGDLTLTDQHKQIIAEQSRKLAGLKSSTIDHITFLKDGTVNATFTSPAISKNDVEKWVKSLGL